MWCTSVMLIFSISFEVILSKTAPYLKHKDLKWKQCNTFYTIQMFNVHNLYLRRYSCVLFTKKTGPLLMWRISTVWCTDTSIIPTTDSDHQCKNQDSTTLKSSELMCNTASNKSLILIWYVVLFHEELQSKLIPLREKLSLLLAVKLSFDLTAQHIKV